MRKRGFEPWSDALEAKTPQLRFWGFKLSSSQSCTFKIFVVALKRGRVPQILNRRGQSILTGTAGSNGTMTDPSIGFELLSEGLLHRRINPHASRLYYRGILPCTLSLSQRDIEPSTDQIQCRDYTTPPPVVISYDGKLLLVVVP